MKPNLQPVQDLRDGFTAETGMETQSGKAADLNPVDSLAACQMVIKPDKRDLRDGLFTQTNKPSETVLAQERADAQIWSDAAIAKQRAVFIHKTEILFSQR